MSDVSHYGRRIVRLSSDPFAGRISHAIVIRPAATLGWHPSNDLVRIHDVAGLAVHAIGRIEVNLLAAGDVGSLHHLVHIRRAKIAAGIAILGDASGVADIGIVNHQMSRLIFLMFGAGMIKIGELVESNSAITFGEAKQLCATIAIGS